MTKTQAPLHLTNRYDCTLYPSPDAAAVAIAVAYWTGDGQYPLTNETASELRAYSLDQILADVSEIEHAEVIFYALQTLTAAVLEGAR